MDRQNMRMPPRDVRRAERPRTGRGVPIWKFAVPALGVVLVAGAAAVGIYGTGPHSTIMAAQPQHDKAKHEAEAELGATHGQQRNNDCTLIVPASPLSAQGLATPYQLTATNPANNNCHEANSTQAVFVQAAVIDPNSGQISIYNPLVIDKGTKPAAAPVVPTLPNGAVVGIWFGSNGMGLRLRGANAGAPQASGCVNGLGNSIFGQVAYCNAPAFFQTANQLIQAGKLTPPPLGIASDGMTCPTVRDFSVVDQDQSDNVTATYLVSQDDTLAQSTDANAAALPGSTTLTNASDNRLLSVALDNALGCTPWTAPDLANPGHMVPAQPLDEIQAAMYQKAPIALVPSGDPMTVVNGQPNVAKQNLYRAGVDQTPTQAGQTAADQRTYCQNLLNIAPARIQLDRTMTVGRASPDAGVANSLFTFLASRFDVTFGPNGLNCAALLHKASPIKVIMKNGIAVDATFAAPANNGAAAQPAATGAGAQPAVTGANTQPAANGTAATPAATGQPATNGQAGQASSTAQPANNGQTSTSPADATPTAQGTGA